ncbi:hypothetical protein [Nocardia carnea]|uniref:hypothetical protein n=1 Tax=Nocardia carnea TaxID=37328 RepID=UPI0024583D48|nr:hypothetical protein [Nocardia carnea]
MAGDLKTDVELLEKASKAWLTEAAPILRDAAGAIEELKYTVVQFGPLFAPAHSAYIPVAQYVQDRLNEGAAMFDQVGNALHSSAASFGTQEFQNEQALNQVAGDMGY